MLATAVMIAACVAKASLLILAAGEGTALVYINLAVGSLVALSLGACAARGAAGFAWLKTGGALLRAVAAASVMALALWPLRDTMPFLTIPLGACVYLGAVVALGAVDAWDRALIRAAWGR